MNGPDPFEWAPEAKIVALTGNTSYNGTAITSVGTDGRGTYKNDPVNYISAGTPASANDLYNYKYPGIAFLGYVKEPAFLTQPGNYEWVQIVNSKSKTESGYGLGGNGHKVTAYPTPGLDGDYPYQRGQDAGIVYNDTLQGSGGNGDTLTIIKPSVADSPEWISEAPNVTGSQYFTMYLMYRQGSSDKDWVPIASMDWSWTGYCTNGKALANVINPQPSNPRPSYPKWMQIVKLQTGS